MTGTPLDPAVGELLSALLDGEVTDEERATAEQWLDRSPEARAEYEELARVRSTLRALPMVEPRPGFLESLAAPPAPSNVVRGPHRWFNGAGAVVASAIATAAAWLVLGGVAPAGEPFVPPLDDVSVAAAGLGPGRPDLSVRGDDGARITVLRQEGEVAWDRLPEGERPADDVWIDLTVPEGTSRVIVVNDEVVWTLASDDLDADDLVDYGEALPGGEGGLLDRARDACDELVDAFSGGLGD